MIKIVDVSTPLLVEELERQQGQDRTGSRDHFRASIVRLGDDSVEPQFGQKWREQEDPSVARFPPSSGPEVQKPLVGDGRFFRAGQVFTSERAGDGTRLARRLALPESRKVI